MKNTKLLALNAVIAALYAVLTIAMAPLSYGPVQVRFSEFMTLLAFLNPRFVPGLVIGCILANLGSPFGIVDIIFGTLATFIAVWGMRFTPNIYAASLLPVVSNAVIIALGLVYLAEIPADMSALSVMLWIGAGEFIAVSFIGIIIMKLLLRSEVLRKNLYI